MDVIGKERHDEQSNMICLESDEFDNRNHNAAYLGNENDISIIYVLDVKRVAADSVQIRDGGLTCCRSFLQDTED